MKITKKSIDDIEVKGKKVFLRVDFNVPVNSAGEVTDDTRIVKAIPTIQELISKGGRVVLVSHLGRPKGKPAPEFSLSCIKPVIEKLLEKTIIFSPGLFDQGFENMLNSMSDGDVMLMENIRFCPEEEKNDLDFSKRIAAFFDCYVADSFGTSHRAHASTHGIASCFDTPVCGYLLKREIDYLSEVLAGKSRPFTAIIGGAKVQDKIPVLMNLLNLADNILIGGGMAYTFLRVKGNHTTGNSLLQEDQIPTVKDILAKADELGRKIYLPEDHIIANEFSNDADIRVSGIDIPDGMMGLDIGPKTIETYSSVIRDSKRVLWNGPMGVFEMSNFQKGTFAIAEAIAHTECLSIVGGGDSVSAANKSGYSDKMSHISTGGGASLEFMEGKSLPGVEILADK